MVHKTLSVLGWIVLTIATCFGQSSFQEITPGASTRNDVAIVLGQPVRTISAALFEYKAPDGIAKIEVEYRAGVRGESTGSGLAGAFVGNVQVTGNLSKGGGSFKIDHPLDPENKYLYHSFVESPDMMNIYNGNITTDENGDAVITLPEYFEALNRDFRYQLTVIGTFAQAIVATEVENDRFTIRTTGPNVKVSWQVTGVRKDPYAKKHRIPVEEAKAEQERGYYLHPEAYGQPADRSVEWAKEPEETRQLRKAMIDSGVSPKSVPPRGSGALIVPERSIKQQ